MASKRIIILGNNFHQSFWRGNQGFYRVVPIVNGKINWAAAPSFYGPISADVMPGSSGDVQAQAEYVLGNKLHQSIWRGNQGFYREVPIINGKIDWNASPTFYGPISSSIVPGTGDIQAQSEFILGGKLNQAIWRGNLGYYRSVPVVNGQIDWNAAPPFSGPITPNDLPVGPQ